MNGFLKVLVSLFQVLLLVTAFSCTSTSAKTGKDTDWKALFEGKTLNAWEVRGGFAKYHVEDKTIVGTTSPGSPNTFLCTRKHYGDFILEFEVKVDPVLQSGVQIRSHVYEKDTPMVVWSGGKKREVVRKAGCIYGYQIKISDEKSGSSGGTWDEGRRSMWLYDVSKDPNTSKAFRDNHWNTYRIECIADSIKTWVNGVLCTDLRDPMDQTGVIGLQVQSAPGEKSSQVRWRNIRIKELGRHIWKPIFDGKSFEGWHLLPGGTWEVRDGVIFGSNTKSDKRQGLLVSDRRYGDFTVRLQFKALKGNSALFFRVEEVGGVRRVAGFQADIDESETTGGLYETGGRGWLVKPAEEDMQKWFKLYDWNQMVVSAHGRRIVVHVNGRKSAELKDDPGRLEGYLALQLHRGHDVQMMFKDIEMLVPKE